MNTSNISLSHLKTAYNNVNNQSYIGQDISLSKFRGCELVVGGATGNLTFEYTGNVQTFTIPAGVTSILVQCWGADGGSGGYFSYSGAYSPGGTGGYAKGDVAVSSGQTVYIYVGGRGHNWSPNGTTGNNGVFVKPASSNFAFGGWGGGVGFGQGGRATKYGMAGGGAATHIRLDSTTLSYRQIIAGGGGGGGNTQTSSALSGGGAGGGTTGQTMANSTQYGGRTPGKGGESTAGTNAAGSWSSTMDGNAHSNAQSHNNLQGGGGGGYYGGGQRDNSTGGGGGSGWIGGSAVTNGLMYSGIDGSKPPNPANVNPLTGDIDGLKHGYIKISYGSQTLSNVPTSGPISIDSDFKGKTFINMAPSMTITAGIDNNTSTSNASTTITFTSTEPTSDFDASSITINMGTLSIPQSTDSLVNNGHKIFTSTLTFDQTSPPNTHTIDVLADAYTNSKTSIGCQNTASASYSITWNNVQPVNGYFVILYTQSTNSYTGDYQIDNIIMNGVTYNFNATDSNGWTATKHSNYFTTFTETTWNNWSSSWYSPPTGGHIGDTNNNGGWQRHNSQYSTSGSTGVTVAPFNTYHLYTETSYYNWDTKILRSPLLENLTSNFTVQWTEAAYGAGMGHRYFYWVSTVPSWSVTQVHYDPNTDQTGSTSTRTGGPYTITIT